MEARCTCICGVCVYEFTSQTMEARCTCVCGVCVYMSSQAKPWRHVARLYVVCEFVCVRVGACVCVRMCT